MKKNIKNLLLACSLIPMVSFATDDWSPSVKFYNTGAMNVADNSSTSLYVAGSMQVGGSSAILQNGTTEITGHFIQDATTHAFEVNSTTGVSTGVGTFKFSGQIRTGKHLITSSTDNASFNRSLYYIAFPNIVINTIDEVTVASRMGIDAISVTQASTGKLHLYSESYVSSGEAYAYDASLRIIGTNSSGTTEAGAVIAERDVTPYIDSVGVGINTPLFGFATPFESQSADYFAGNWISTVTEGTNQTISDPLDFSGYITVNGQSLTGGSPQFVRLRDKSSDYNLAKDIIPAMSGQDLNKTITKFEFNGYVYGTSKSETLFTDDAITRTITTGGSAVNWIIGNSYSAPISLSKLSAAMTSSSLTFDNYIYLFPTGSTDYVAYDRTAMPSTYSEIPQTEIFMLKPTSTSSTGTFNVSKDLLTHGTASHTKSAQIKSLKASSSIVYNDQISLTARLASNRNIFANTTVTIADGSSTTRDAYDATMDGYYPFGLYTLSSDSIALLANKTPTVTDSIPLEFKVITQTTSFDLDLTQLDLVKGEGFWLRDKQDGSLTQMTEGDTYTFTASPSDNANRFVIYLMNPKSTTGIETSNASNIYAYCHLTTLNITRLTDIDMGARVMIFDVQGRKLMETTVEDTPKQIINVSGLTTGVYILKMEGKRNYTTKFTVNS